MYGNRKVSNFLLAAAIVAGALFLHKYLGVFALAALTTLIFAPLHNWLLKRKVRIAKLATAITIFAIILSLLAPLFTIIGLAYYEANQASSSIKNNELKGANLDKFTATLNDTAHDLGINISHDSISNKIKALSKKAIPGILDFIFNTVGSIAIFVTDVIVYFMLLATMLSRKYQLVDALKRLSPFANSVNNEYLSKVKANIHGQRQLYYCTYSFINKLSDAMDNWFSLSYSVVYTVHDYVFNTAWSRHYLCSYRYYIVAYGKYLARYPYIGGPVYSVK
jgi:predicted PurR-regulated permease PerM